MFHIFYKAAKSLILPLICILIEVYLLKRKKIKHSKLQICGKWFLFWVVGFGSFGAGLMQAFNPSYTAALLNVKTEDFIVIRELGSANLGIGILGLLSIKFASFKKPAAVMAGVFILGATIIHLARIHSIETGELISLVDDVWILIVACFTILYKPNLVKQKLAV